MNRTSTKKITDQIDTEMKAHCDDKNEFLYEPGKNVISNILNYSKALSIRKSKHMDHFEMVLN